MIDRITEALDNGDNVTGIFFEFSKAFDTVNHSVILYQLSHYGIRGPALIGLKVTYLTGTNSLHIMVLPQLQKQSTVVFRKDQSLVHCCLWFILMICITYAKDLYQSCLQMTRICFTVL